MSIKITLPIPDKSLSPNARVHWAKKAKAAKAAKELAFYSARAAGVYRQEWKRANWSAAFHFKVERVRDVDNAISSCKAYLDGIVKAGLMVNDRGLLPPTSVEFVIDKNSPECVVLEFEELA